MAGNIENSANWRLKTSTGIPYKVLSMDGDLGKEEASVSVSVLIEATNLLAFAAFLMPPPIRVGNLEYPTFTSLAGINQITVQSIRFRSQDDGMPIDPFSADFGAPSKTYYPVIQVDINYASSKTDEANPNDPFTFLEISGNATGQFLHVSLEDARWQPEKGKKVGKADEVPGDGIDPETNETDCIREGDPGCNENDGDAEINRDPNIPVPILVPQTEWTVRWPQIRFDLFRDVYVHRLRILSGRVNSLRFPFLFNAEPETLLFMGYSYKQANTWRDGEVNKPTAALEMKIIEKRVLWKGVIVGHNHFWRPGKGWQRLLLNAEGDPAYRSWDYNNLFKI